MKVLGIDTSSRNLAVCIAEGNDVVWSEDYTEQFRHIEKLIPLVHKGCKKAKIALDEIDIVACGVGPGSFTGLRVGIAAVKGLALAQKKKVIAFSSLDLIAQNVTNDADIIVLLDARREKLYCARYERSKGIQKKKKDDRLISLAAFAASVNRRTKPVFIVGDAIRTYGQTLKKMCGATIRLAPETLWYPQARLIARTVFERMEKRSFDSVQSVEPHYLRLTPAEEAHNKKRQK